ncbi:MAG: CRISPR-associated endonuclease Cas2 [Alistipes sp.]|nr:CRISPR-associated endonuclease Cas2 [Alistipes sp.]MDD7127898.1 CRISPR-associated endonuclease Cas2 [Prevotella sp.]MDD7710791.1 CRISPR-associated endonuclease Cas2 [Alistipes sp.]
MPRAKKPPLSFVDQMKKLIASGINDSPKIVVKDDSEALTPLEERVQDILGLSDNARKRKDRMLFFVMYDIESDKVRRLVVKYLIREGCTRIQKSIFLADRPVATYNKIKSDLAEVQAVYDNEDSIIVLPVTTDYLRMMKVIGKNIDVDIITHNKNTLFF